ncbi:hypothetical protein PSTT_05403, partial [Puccinia striiformis]
RRILTPKQADNQPAFEFGPIRSGLISKLSASELIDGITIGKEITSWERRLALDFSALKITEGSADRATGAMNDVVNELLPPFQNSIGEEERLMIILAMIACSLVAASMKEDRKKKCTFKCSTLHYPLVGGCATIIGHDFQGLPNKWQIKHAYKTEGHDQFWNCLGTGMKMSICCLPGKIVIPPKANVLLQNATPI